MSKVDVSHFRFSFLLFFFFSFVHSFFLCSDLFYPTMSAGKAVVPYRTPQRKHSRPAAEAIRCIAGQKHHSLSVTIHDTIHISPHFASLP